MESGVHQVTFAISLETNDALLALRFWDQALALPVTSGLDVTVRPAEGRTWREAARQAGDGWFIFRSLPGVTRNPPSSDAPFIIEVQDQQQRFLPVVLQTTLPGTGHDPTLALAQAGPAQQGDGWLVLYSAPTRRAPPGLATITGQLWDRTSDTPAAFAVLDVQAGDDTWRGLADHRGCISLLFPYPVLRPSLQAVGSGALPQASWSVALSVRYGGGPWRYPAGTGTPAVREVPVQPPDLREILAQPAARLFPSTRHGPASPWNQVVRFGQELILRTDHTSRLTIEPEPSSAS